MFGEPLQSSLLAATREKQQEQQVVDLGHDVCLGPVLGATGAVLGLLTQNGCVFGDWGWRE